jgi:cobyrinic acid a,c-diamide synthase
MLPAHDTTLVPLADNPDADHALARMAAAMERHCDLDLIERLMESAPPLTVVAPAAFPKAEGPPVRIGVAFDDAFSSYYAENLELLEEAGAEILPFSPLEDRGIPREADALYFGGGMREQHVRALSRNRQLIESVRRAHAHDLPIYAEGGGAALSARSVTLSDGTVHEMAALVPVEIGMNSAHWHVGYRTLTLPRDCLIGGGGEEIRGYEFHSNTMLRGCDQVEAAYAVHDAEGEPLGMDGWAKENLLASFVHLHFGQSAGLARTFVTRCRAAREQRLTSVGAYR